jgi:uncharacterized protein YgfB (UPF0149 family)
MKRHADKILIAAFCLLCVAAPLMGVVLRVLHGGAAAENQEENRKLADFPVIEKLADLETFPAGFTDYFSDHLFFKEQLVNLKSFAELHLFGELESEKVIAGTKKPWLFNQSEDGQPLQTYKRTNCFDDEELQEITENLEALRADLEDAGIGFVLMISPDKEQIYGMEYMPSSVKVEDHPSRTEQLIAYMQEQAPELTVVYPKETLIAAKSDYPVPIYYESDTHWNQIGAGIACRELLGTIAGMGQADGADQENQLFTIEGTERKRGDLQKMVRLGSDYDSNEYLVTMQHTSVQEEETRDQNDEVIHEKNRSDAADALPVKLYLTGDSFRWNLSPFLKEQVQESVISSRYYFDTDDLAAEEPDVFVYMIAERYLHELTMIPGYNTMALQLKE